MSPYDTTQPVKVVIREIIYEEALGGKPGIIIRRVKGQEELERVRISSPEEFEDGDRLDENAMGCLMSSLGRVELVMEIEEAYGIEIPDEDIRDLTTVVALVQYIYRILEEDD